MYQRLPCRLISILAAGAVAAADNTLAEAAAGNSLGVGAARSRAAVAAAWLQPR